MSKQSEAKEKQNYCAKPERTCKFCKHLTQDFYHYGGLDKRYARIEGKNPGPEDCHRIYSENLRCDIGRFAVKKTATCDNFERS